MGNIMMLSFYRQSASKQKLVLVFCKFILINQVKIEG